MKLFNLTSWRRLFRKPEIKPTGKPFDLYPDDVFLVSYPKSGNTWLRFMIGNYITNCAVDFTNNHLLIPDIHFNPEKCAELESRPRFIKSHMPYTAQYPKVIYIIRDGRDVAVSYFYYAQKMGLLDKSTSFSTFLKEFTQSGVGSYGSWSSHVESWTAGERPNVLVIKYEDMLENAAIQLERTLRFAGVDCDVTKIEAAVEASKFNKMQNLEIQQHDLVFVQMRGITDDSIRFVRKGESGDWLNHFSKEDELYFGKTNDHVLDKFGYLK